MPLLDKETEPVQHILTHCCILQKKESPLEITSLFQELLSKHYYSHLHHEGKLLCVIPQGNNNNIKKYNK